MAQFEWRPSEIAFDASNGEVDVRIPDCGGPGAEWVLVDKLTVTVHKDGRVTIDVEFSTSDDRAGSFDGENPAEYDEEAKANWRSLLKHLGYKRGEKWTWERP